MGKSVVKTWTEQLFSITGAAGEQVAVISKEIFHMTDTYVLDIVNPVNALRVLMFVLAIDAEKCSGSSDLGNGYAQDSLSVESSSSAALRSWLKSPPHNT